ncbi:MAG: trigger factor, partial [Alphaproteobacteria bacterium]
MEIVENSSEGLQREFTITVFAKDIEEKLNARLEELGKTVKMPGFRAGKVPLPLLKKQHGPSVMGEILERAVNDSSHQALMEKGLRPAAEPKIEIKAFADGSDLEYTMVVELMPEIEPMDFSAINLDRLVVEVSNGDVDEAAQRLAEESREFETVESARKATKDDVLLVDFVGRVDGEAFEGGTAKDFQLELSSTSFVPGFVEPLIGAKAGDQVLVKVTFPDDYTSTELAGKDAEFTVDVKELRTPKPVAVDDDLAKRLQFDNVDAFKKAVRQRLEGEYASIARMRLKRTLLDDLANRCDFPVPQGLVDKEFESIWQGVQEELKKGGEEAKEVAGKSEDDLRGEYRAIAERRIRLGLLLSEIGRTNNIEVTQDEINNAIAAEAQRFPGQEKRVFE